MPDPSKMEAAEWSAAIEHARAKGEHDIDLYFRVLAQYQGPEGWAQLSRGGFYMTRQELLAFYKEYIALQWKYGHTARDAPDGARPVALRFFAVPDETALDGNSGELRLRELVTSSLHSRSARLTCGCAWPSTRATNARASRICPGTAGIVMLSGTAGTADADIKDTDPPWPVPARSGTLTTAGAGRCTLR
jgi:hypothetical protein